MRCLRLLVVSSDTYPPTRVDLSVLFGVELAGRGHTVDLILQSEADCGRSYATTWPGGRAWIGATDRGPSLPARVSKHLHGLANDLRIFSRLRRPYYDAVEVKDKFLSGVMALVASRIFPTRFIYWLSYPFPEHYLQRAADGTARYPFLYRIRGSVFKWLLYRWLLPRADHIFVQSEQMRLDVAAQGIPLDKMTAVPMGVRLDLCAAQDLSLNRRLLPRAVPCVLYLGTLNRVRRLEFLLAAFARVVAAAPETLLYLVGEGDHPEDRAFLEAETARLNLSASVIFVGRLPQDQALTYVQEADICVSPFHPTPILRSTSPTKLVEYMAAGKPVVANDHPEQRRVIEQSGGGLCVEYTESAFAAAILALIGDPQAARAMGERGRRYVIEHRSYGVIADLVERRLREVVGDAC
jgi:glycosyltransferase involved in cell wall biosynthesis